MILYLHLTIFGILAYAIALKMYKKDLGAFTTIIVISSISLMLDENCNSFVILSLIIFSIIICFYDLLKRHSKCWR